VVVRDLTIVVEIGEVDAVAVLADGEPIDSRYDPEAGTVTFTTDAENLTLVLDSPVSDSLSIGDASLTALKYDKPWAVSLGFDDGYLTHYTNAFEYLDRYGYKGSIGVIGKYLDTPHPDFMTSAHVRELIEKGWEIANHSYSHRMVSYYRNLGMKDGQIVAAEILKCNEVIERASPGYSPYSFFVPFCDSNYLPILRAYSEELGFGTVGTCRWPIHEVNEVPDVQPFEFGRSPMPRNGSLFDDVHELVEKYPGTHYWLRVYDHSVDEYASRTEMAVDYLYYHYGAGGTDEVWVDTVMAVHQYIICQRHSTITRIVSDPPPSLEGLIWAEGPATVEPTPETTRVVLRNGVDGYSGTRDTYLYLWEPNTPHGDAGKLLVRSFDVSRALLYFDISRIPVGADVIDARLHLYCDDQNRHQGDDTTSITVEIYGVEKEWEEGRADWYQATDEDDWTEAGCLAEGADYAPGRIGLPPRTLIEEGNCRYTGEGDCWYTFDVTSLVGQWAADPSQNKGILVRALSAASIGTFFVSSEHASTTEHPALEVSYVLSPPTATPTATLTPTATATPTATVPPSTATPTLGPGFYVPLMWK